MGVVLYIQLNYRQPNELFYSLENRSLADFWE
jgi:hypothetical protein